MSRSISLIAVAALLSAAACSDKDPLSAGTEAEIDAAPGAAKLTVSSNRAGGKFNRRPVQSRPLQIDGSSAPIARLELPFGQTQTQGDVQLTLLSVQDSRCPEGAVCVWEGEVIVEIGLAEGGEELDPITLRLHAGEREAALATVSTRTIVLLGVSPHPVVDVQIEEADYVAAVSIGQGLPSIPRKGRLTISDGRVGGDEEHPLPRPTKPKPLDPDSPILAALAENRDKWDEQGGANYTFNFQRICFCLQDFVREAVVTVEDGRIAAAVFADTGEAVGQEIVDAYYTVDQLFGQIEEAVRESAEIIRVTYDEELGYPTDLFIDFSTGIADEEFTVTASNVMLVP